MESESTTTCAQTDGRVYSCHAHMRGIGERAQEPERKRNEVHSQNEPAGRAQPNSGWCESGDTPRGLTLMSVGSTIKALHTRNPPHAAHCQKNCYRRGGEKHECGSVGRREKMRHVEMRERRRAREEWDVSRRTRCCPYLSIT